MKRIISRQQLKDLRIGSILIQHATDNTIENQPALAESSPRIRFQVAGCTPIGWEDIEFELKTDDNFKTAPASGTLTTMEDSRSEIGGINILGSELINDRRWWLKD